MMAVSEEDKKLFRSAVTDVKPLKQPNRTATHANTNTVSHYPDPTPNKSQHNKTPNNPPFNQPKTTNREKSTTHSSQNLSAHTSQSVAINTHFQSNDAIGFAKNGVSVKLIKRIKQGKLEHTPPLLDLHGLTLTQAHSSLNTFITHHHNKRYLHIIHGKGHRSANSTPVLKNYTASFLMQHPRVLAIYSCPPNQGGTGAVFVLLKQNINKTVTKLKV